jgi:hypothetical protein
MKNNKIFSIVFFSVLGVALLMFFYFNMSSNRYNWRETYDPKSSQPYGTQFIREMLKSYATEGFVYNTKKPIYQLLDSASVGKKSAYVFIGNSMYMDSLDIQAMQNYVNSGNDAFLITPYLSHGMSAAFYKAECSSSIFSQTIDTITIAANFYHPEFAVTRPYSFAFRINDKDVKYYWEYLSTSALCDSVESIVPLGYFEPSFVNFFKIPYGQGNLYIHTNPVLFTNYFMVKERNTEYASSVFSHTSSKTILWDEYSKVPFYKKGRNPYYNPLYYVMQQPSLQYAWWVMLALVLLYVFFAAKRRQRFIPVLEQKVNTSLAFLKMVASLHYQHQNHGNMARKKMRHFLHLIRTKYALSTHKIDGDLIKKLSVKSQVTVGEIEIIFDQYHIVEKFQDIDSQRLADLYNAIQNFYNKAK